MIFEGGAVGVIVGMHGVGANWKVLKWTSVEHPIAVHVVGACGPPVPRRASTMASYSPLGSPVFPWSRFLRYSYRWRPGKTSDTTTALLQIHAFPSQSPHIPHQLLIRDMWTSSFWNLQTTISYKMLTHFQQRYDHPQMPQKIKVNVSSTLPSIKVTRRRNTHPIHTPQEAPIGMSRSHFWA